MVNMIYIVGGEKRCRPLKSLEDYIKACNTAENRRNWDMYRQTGEDRYKRALVQVNYNCQVAEGGLLKGCQTVSPFLFYDIDCRDREECRRIINQLLQMKQELGLVEVAESASYGVHAVARRAPGHTILEGQVRISMLTQTEMDTNNKENNRVVFHGPIDAETTPLLEEALFTESLSDEEAAAEYQRLKERERKGLEEVPPGAKKANKHYRPWEDTTTEVSSKTAQTVKSTAEAIAPTERERHIFREAMRHEDVSECDFNDEGGRHNTVKNVLGFASQLLTEGEFLGCLSEVMPQYWQDANIRQLVSDYYVRYTDSHRPLTREQKRVWRESRQMEKPGGDEPAAADNTQPLHGDTAELAAIYACRQAPLPPLLLPRLVKAVTAPVPADLKPTVAIGVMPALAAYPKGLSFRYIDNQPRELRINCLVVAETGSGKDSCLAQPLAHILAAMHERDAESRRKLEDYNKAFNAKASNKEKPQRPDDAVVQHIKADITRARLAQAADDAQGATLYVRMNEMEEWERLEGARGRQNQFTTLKKADDEGNDFGQDRASTQSVNFDGCLRLNWSANTTPAKAQDLFRHVAVDGPLSRLSLATTPDRGIGAPIPVYGDFDERYDAALNPFIDNLQKATGYKDCPQARRMAQRLKEELDDFCRLSQSKTLDNLGHRALVAVFRKACLIYAANGMKWERAIDGWCRWALHYDLWLKLSFFSDMISQANQQVKTSKRGPRNLLELLPDEFTRGDAVRVRTQQGLSAEKTGNMLSVWKTRGYILQMTDDSFRKVIVEQQKQTYDSPQDETDRALHARGDDEEQ